MANRLPSHHGGDRDNDRAPNPPSRHVEPNRPPANRGHGGGDGGGRPSTYRIRRGDTLAEIAQRFGVTVAQLARWNNISDPDRIYAGHTLRLHGGNGGGGSHHGGNSGGGHGHGGGGGGDAGKPEIDERDLAAEYHWSLAFLNSDPELKHLFDQAVANTWTPQRFVAELRDTKWFKHHSATARKYYVNKITDPKTWARDVDRNAQHIQTVYRQMLGTKTGMSWKTAEKWAMRAMRFGWSEEQIDAHVVDSINWGHQIKRGNLSGSAGQARAQIHQLVHQYGVRLGHDSYAAFVRNMVAGQQNLDSIKSRLMRMAKSKYAGFADQLDSGMTMQEIADPYKQSMAQLFEMNPNDISLENHRIQHALTRRKDGKVDPMGINEFEDHLRHTDRWLHTDQANTMFTDAALNLAKQWGLA